MSELAIIKDNTIVTLGALSGQAVAAQAGPVLKQGYRIVKTIWSAVAIGLTAAEATGLILGLANNDLTAAQIKESLEAGGPLNRGDRDLEEKANRFTKQMGMMETPLVAATESRFKGPEGGSPTESKIMWSFPLGNAGFKWWIYNLGTGLTTGASVRVLATHMGVWLE